MKPLGGLFCDLYELTMVAGYLKSGKNTQHAVFEYFFRRLPEHSGFAVFAGLDDLLDDLRDLRFSDTDIGYLESLGLFDTDTLHYFSDMRFQGDVWSAPEGMPVFPYEPVVAVRASLPQAQLIETLLLCRLNYQTLVATKASRVRIAASNDQVMEFGLRRAQGPDGGMSGTRAAIIGGCDSTSNTQAGKCFSVPVVGTQAHSWIMSFPSELDSFRAYANVFPEHLILLVDTYDTLNSGVPNAIRVFKELRERGWRGKPGIRLDSGDPAVLSIKAYQMLADAGFPDASIVVSSDLDEYVISDAKARGSKANVWGVGTRLMTGGFDPALTGVYKLAAIEDQGTWLSKFKISDSPEKTSDPGWLIPVRFTGENGFITCDVLFDAHDQSWKSGSVVAYDRLTLQPLCELPHTYHRSPTLAQVMQDGKRISQKAEVLDIRGFALEQITRIRPDMRDLHEPAAYTVALSAEVAEKKRSAINQYQRLP